MLCVHTVAPPWTPTLMGASPWAPPERGCAPRLGALTPLGSQVLGVPLPELRTT